MKAKINYKSKKTIIIIAIAVVLLIAAITGTVAFIKGNNNAAAAMENSEITEPANNGNDSNNNGGVENANTPNTENPQEQIPTIDENQNQTTPAQNGNTTTGTTNPGTTTGTTTGNAGTTVPDTEYTQTTVVENPWKTEDITWMPISLQAKTETTGLNINTPNLEVSKTAYVGNQEISAEPVNTVAQPGQEITYVIRIKNTGNLATSTIRTVDAIPEGTEIVEGTISEGGVLANGKITWKNVIKAGETVELTFKVKVISETEITLISNTAKVNGEDTPTTETPVVTTAKDVYVVVDGDLANAESAKVGDTLRYIITISNNSEVAGKTIVTDNIPDGTTLVKGTISEGGVLEGNTITWENVEVGANGETTVSFDVTINQDRTESVTNVAIVGEKETPPTETKVANITGTKTVDKTEAKVGDTLKYTIILTNSGNANGTVTVTDNIPEGTTLVEGTISEGGVLEGNTITWNNVEVAANNGETTVSFDVTINQDRKESVTNSAIVGEQETPPTETKVANITGTKTVDETEAKVGDTLKYTIILTNSGNANGTVTVTDAIPTGTKIKDATIKGYDSTTNTMTWSNVEVKAKGTTTLTLEVVVEGGVSEIENTAKIDNNEIPEKPVTTVKYHYTVEHYTENPDGRAYTKVEEDTTIINDVLEGTETSYTANEYVGFTFDDEKTVNKGAKVPANNDLVIKLYYTRNSYKVTYKYGGTVPTGASQLPAEATYKYGADVKVAKDATAPGYTFSGWSEEDFRMPANDVEIEGSFRANTNTEYKVEHYLQNLNDSDYTIDNTATETKTGTTGEMTQAEAKSYPGFTAQDFNQEVIAGDGSTVVRIYYTRNSYKVTYKYGGTVPTGASQLPADATYKYGADVKVAKDATAPGYTFSGWDKEDFTMPAKDVEIKGSFTANTNTEYKVEHYLQNLNDSDYTIDNTATETKTGTTGEMTDAKAKSYPGFTAKDFNQEVIAGDGSTVVRIYYTRNSYKVTYKYGGTVPTGASQLPAEATYKYGADVKVAKDATAPGYTFSGWDKEDFTMPAEDVEIKGSFTANTNTEYKVEHYLQNLNDSDYTIDNTATETKTGTTGEMTQAEAKNYPGFTAKDFNQEVIAGDGSTVVRIYYTRNSYKVTYKYGGTVPTGASQLPAEATYKYGADVKVAKDATAPGYKFSGWDHEDFTMPAKDVEIKGSFTANTNTEYKVEHYLQNLNDSDYTIDNTATETKTGTTGEMTQAEAKSYPGFTAQDFNQEVIAGDGSTVVRIYYIRNSYTYTIHYFYNGVEDVNKKEGPFEAKFEEEINTISDNSEDGKYTQYDVTSSNKTAKAILTIGIGENFINVYYGTPNVTINKEVNKSTANTGDTLHYTITVAENRGLVDAKSIKVTDNLPSELNVIPESITQDGKLNDAKTSIEWNIEKIEKGQSIKLEFDAKIKDSSIGEVITNKAILNDTTNSNDATTTVNKRTVEVREITKGREAEDVNIIFIMDNSSSMNEPIANTSYSNDDSYYVAPSDEQKTRLNSAKTATKEFINKIYADKNLKNTNMSVITFNKEENKAKDTAYVIGRGPYTSDKVKRNYKGYYVKENGEQIYVTEATDGKYYEINKTEIKTGANVIGSATSSNYSELVTKADDITIGCRREGFGTYINPALEQAKTIIEGYKNNETTKNNRNIVIVLCDGDINGQYTNSLNNLKGDKNTAGLADEIYCIGFGKDAANPEKKAYKTLANMTTVYEKDKSGNLVKKVYTAENTETLIQEFTSILENLNDKKNYITGTSDIVSDIKCGEIAVKASDKIEMPLLVYNNDIAVITCTSKEELANYGMSYDESNQIIRWNINECIEKNPTIDLSGTLKLRYYIPLN